MLLKSFTSRTDIIFAETPSAHTVNSSSVGAVQTVKALQCTHSEALTVNSYSVGRSTMIYCYVHDENPNEKSQ